MKFSEQWLREWVNPPVTTDTLVEQLTGAGLEVDGVEAAAGDFTGVTVGEVLSVAPHPSADRLSLCSVSNGTGDPVSVVCGAPNVFAGMRAPLASPGARLPGGIKIRKSRIRGEESHGMLCSAKELGISDDADGIISLPPDAPLGQALSEYMGLDDQVIDVDLTPNRGDCLGIAGIAREVGVLNRCPVSSPAGGAVAAQIDDVLPIVLEAPDDCPRYIGRIIRGINADAQTPLWMLERLRRSGVRPISPVVDISNYVMLELGQPMHAFDLNRIDRGIRVRRAKADERLTLLDGNEVVLDSEALVIADESKPVALAGVMGGLDSSVTGATQDILLEAAWFEPRIVRVESRRLDLHTDASHRYERGVDSELQRAAAERATELLLAIVGGQAGPIIEAVVTDSLPPPAEIVLRAARITRVLGLEVDSSSVRDTLERLGMSVQDAQPGQWTVAVPSFRSDVRIEADLIEEVARIVGYDEIPRHAPPAPLDMRARPEDRIGLPVLRAKLMERGFAEAITFSFTDPTLQAELDPDATAIALSNPISSELSVMRTSLWPGLLGATMHNLNRQQTRVRLFETGLTFRVNNDSVSQVAVLGGVVCGPVVPEQWGVARVNADFFDVKADVQSLLDASRAGRGAEFVADSHPALHPGQTAKIYVEGQAAGWLGALHPKIQQAHKLLSPLYFFELSQDALARGALPRFQALSRFPAVRRDLAVVVDEGVCAQQIRNCVGQAGLDSLHYLELFDVYRGEGIDSGRKSIALGLTFQDPSRTLRDAEVDRCVDVILTGLKEQLNAKLRG